MRIVNLEKTCVDCWKHTKSCNGQTTWLPLCNYRLSLIQCIHIWWKGVGCSIWYLCVLNHGWFLWPNLVWFISSFLWPLNISYSWTRVMQRFREFFWKSWSMEFLVMPLSYKLSFPHIAHVCLNIGTKIFIFGKNFILRCELDTSNSIVV